MYKTTSLILASVLLTGTAFARGAPAPVSQPAMASCPSMNYTGFYLGPKIAGTFQGGSYKATDSGNSANQLTGKNSGGAAFAGGLNFGYGYQMHNNFFVGLDASVLLHTLDNEVANAKQAGGPNLRAKLENEFLYHVAVQLGYKLESDILPYLSLGVMGGEYKVKLENNTATAGYGLGANSNQSFKKNRLAFTPGAGIKGTFGPNLRNWVWSAEYDYMHGKKHSKTFTEATTPSTWNHEYKVRQHMVSFAVVYKF